MTQTAEHQRLVAHRDRKANWKNWGPYLSERAWGTVREDYSADSEAWDYFPHDHARRRAYRWNEDGLAGISDRQQHLCFSLALWNGHDPFLKERLFGLSGPQGNHGEDVKEVYFYLDNTPTHSYMSMLYKYPQAAFPYDDLVQENARRDRSAYEYELLDTGIFAENRYFDILVEYAKADQNDILIRIKAVNHGPSEAPLFILPTLWFRNTWSWGYPSGPMGDVPGKPLLRELEHSGNAACIRADHPTAGTYYLYAGARPQLLFTENETNSEFSGGLPNASEYTKEAFHRYVIDGNVTALNPAQEGTKAAALYETSVMPTEPLQLWLRLSANEHEAPFTDFQQLFDQRLNEADEFYNAIQNPDLNPDERSVQRQAFAGMLWSKQLYYYDVEQWLNGDPAAAPPAVRKQGRNHEWRHLNNFDIISMPDKWEYPWYATWDTAFHCIPLVLLDPQFAKRQLDVITREWYMHPNGQLPAYEWNFGDVNPPVHAWAAWRVYKIDAKATGTPDREFLEGVFHKLLLNFTWWVNRKDEDGRNVFQGGFLGLDNISIFNRSKALPTGGHIDQADGTAWMAFYSLGMLRIALELAQENAVYQDIATKFFEHFLRIAHAMTDLGGEGVALWDEEDGFFYDALHLPGQRTIPLRVRSLVGLIPLLAVDTLEESLLDSLPVFSRRIDWFTHNRPHLSGNMAEIDIPGIGERHLLAILTPERLRRVLHIMLDENEFLSPYGLRSVSKYHEQHPYTFTVDGEDHTLNYEPAESETPLFGGNSNWRGPVWFPINYLIIESLQKFYHYYGDDFRVEYPTGSGSEATLWEIAADLSQRLTRIFLRNEEGQRPVYGGADQFQNDPEWRDFILFYEYFHADNGAGLGASHQTGWTGLVAKLLQQSGGKLE